MIPDFPVMRQIIEKLACLLFLAVSALPIMAETREFVGLPIGVFAVPRDLLYLAKLQGFEVVHNYRFEESRDKNDELAAYLDEAHNLGLKVMVGFDRKENYTVSKVVERVRRFRAHPALWAWYLCDEPKMAMLNQVAEIAATIRREDAGNLLAIATDAAPFAALADLVFAYTYPVKDQQFPLQDLSSYMHSIDRFVEAKNPFCVLVQTFNWNHYLPSDKKRRGNRHPTAEEMRFMAFYGVMRGARGVFFFSFQTLPGETENLNQVAELLGLLKAVRGHLGGDAIPPGGFTDYPHAAAWRQKAGALLLLTNPTSRRNSATLKKGPWTLGDLTDPEAEILPGALRLEPWGSRAVLIREKPVPGQ